jgi:DUF4097 and DUF4098 domain-containing protein YvlB
MRTANLLRNWAAAGLWLAAGTALLGAAACNLQIGTGIEARETWTRTYPVSAGATLDVKETNGRITVEAVDAEAISVTATIVVKAATEEAARAAAKDHKIEETSSADRVALDGTGKGLQIAIGLSRHIEYDIKVPKSTNVTLRVTNGDVDVRGIEGFLRVEGTNGRIAADALGSGADVTSTNGRVALAFAKIGSSGVRCKTVNGQIIVTVPTTASATIAGRVMNGRIATENLSITATEESRRRLDATIGGGGPEIRLETTNGEVRIVGR